MSRPHQHILGGVDAGGELRRPPLVGMDFLHQRPMRTDDFFRPRLRLQAKDLIRLLFRHYARPTEPSPAAPPVRVALRALTPAGRPAVTITFGRG